MQQCAAGPEIIVATPGRLTDFLERDLINLSYTRFLVLDEADRMLDMGFEPQLRRIVTNSSLPTAANRQTLMFSATFAAGVQRVAQAYLKRDYVFVSVGRVGSTTSSISQKIVHVPENACDKRSKLNILLEQSLLVKGERTIVFVQKKHVANWVKRELRKVFSVLP